MELHQCVLYYKDQEYLIKIKRNFLLIKMNHLVIFQLLQLLQLIKMIIKRKMKINKKFIIDFKRN